MNTFLVELAVQRGINYLNSIEPDWFTKIDLDSLDLRNPSYCILGQLYEDYNNHDIHMLQSELCGFTVLNNNNYLCNYYMNEDSVVKTDLFKKLTKEWKRKILEMKAK